MATRTKKSEEEHLETLERVLARLEESVAHTIASLYRLLWYASTPWQWISQEQSAFEASKELLAAQVLAHYDPQYPKHTSQSLINLRVILLLNIHNLSSHPLGHTPERVHSKGLGFIPRRLRKPHPKA